MHDGPCNCQLGPTRIAVDPDCKCPCHESLVRVLEVDQWTSTGDIAGRSLEVGFDLSTVTGGDSESVRRLGIVCARVVSVRADDRPPLARVWFREVGGKLERWKTNYDSSG